MNLNPFTKPTAQDLARQTLDDAQRQLLLHQSQQEYHAAMAGYYEQMIRRLSVMTNQTKE